MKRSQFLKKLYDAVDLHIEANSDENTVDYLLNECETLGMVYCKKQNLGDMGTMVVPEGWGPEDEKE